MTEKGVGQAKPNFDYGLLPHGTNVNIEFPSCDGSWMIGKKTKDAAVES